MSQGGRTAVAMVLALLGAGCTTCGLDQVPVVDRTGALPEADRSRLLAWMGAFQARSATTVCLTSVSVEEELEVHGEHVAGAFAVTGPPRIRLDATFGTDRLTLFHELCHAADQGRSAEHAPLLDDDPLPGFGDLPPARHRREAFAQRCEAGPFPFTDLARHLSDTCGWSPPLDEGDPQRGLEEALWVPDAGAVGLTLEDLAPRPPRPPLVLQSHGAGIALHPAGDGLAALGVSDDGQPAVVWWPGPSEDAAIPDPERVPLPGVPAYRMDALRILAVDGSQALVGLPLRAETWWWVARDGRVVPVAPTDSRVWPGAMVDGVALLGVPGTPHADTLREVVPPWSDTPGATWWHPPGRASGVIAGSGEALLLDHHEALSRQVVPPTGGWGHQVHATDLRAPGAPRARLPQARALALHEGALWGLLEHIDARGVHHAVVRAPLDTGTVAIDPDPCLPDRTAPQLVPWGGTVHLVEHDLDTPDGATLHRHTHRWTLTPLGDGEPAQPR